MKFNKFKASCFYISLILLPHFCYADVDIKLNCRLTINKNYISGTTETNTKNVVVGLYQTPKFLSIMPNDVDLSAVGDGKFPESVSVNNFSDANKWDLTNSRSIEGKAIRTSIQIDRNTGFMTYYHDFKNGAIVIDANGICEKIDTTKKKF